MPETDTTVELHIFRQRARDWLAANLPAAGAARNPYMDFVDATNTAEIRALQGRLYDAGFAGICYPTVYGGQGLTPDHQRVFNEEARDYHLPEVLNVPSLTILGPTLLDCGTEEQKHRHLPRILRGDEIWVQLLSEPTGGSDLAAAVMRATPDGDHFILNGSKVWSTGADRCDYAMCLARTDWDAPKHRGLTMFIVNLRAPGITIEPIRQVNGSAEFCQEYFDDVAVPASDVVGDVNGGWTVATRLLEHEHFAVGGDSPYGSGPPYRFADYVFRDDIPRLARESGRAGDPRVRQMVAEAHALGLVHEHLVHRVARGVALGHYPRAAGAITKLLDAALVVRCSDMTIELTGAAGVAWPEHDSDGGTYARQYLFRQAYCIGGGTTEIQRNIVSERVLGMPREVSPDRDAPFRDVRHNPMPGARP